MDERVREMTCTEFLALLDDMLDDAIQPGLRAQLQEHLESCDHCEVTLSTTRKTIQIYRSNQIYEMPPGLRERLHAAIMARCKKGC
jgi:anti-sigma factor RsiW